MVLKKLFVQTIGDADSNQNKEQKLQKLIENLNSQDDYIIDNFKPIESNSIEYNFDSFTYSNIVWK